MNSKKYEFTYEDYEEGKEGTDLIEMILADDELPKLDEVIIGSWGSAWENSCQDIIDKIIENKERFSHIKRLFVGDMDMEDCEVSWIIQGNYNGLLQALPNLESLTIQGSTDLSLGTLESEKLKELEIICGGLPKEVIQSVRDAKLPALEELRLYIGVEDYGFDGSIADIKDCFM